MADWARRIGAGIFTVLGIWMFGAVVAGMFAEPGGKASGIALGVALVVCVALPLGLELRVTSAIRKQDATAKPVRASALLAFNVLVVLGLMLLVAGRTRRALEERASWPAFGAPVGFLDAAGDKVVSVMPFGQAESLAPVAAATASAEVSAAPASSASAPPVTSSASVSATVHASAPPPAVVEKDLEATELYELRADAVVVIRSRDTLPPDSPEAQVLGITVALSQGSGFFIDGTGLIMTNHHVVDGSESLLVRLRDGRTFGKVTLLAKSVKNDLALLSVEGAGLPYLPLADVRPKVGQKTFAIGSPSGLEFTLTQGIVSALRDQKGTKVLQVDTTIAPGSSGGPMFDARGRVVGVAVSTQGAGLNFAVDVNHVRDLLSAERKPLPYKPWADATKVENLVVEGAEIGPTAKTNLADFADSVSMILDACLAGPGPETAKAKFALPKARGPLPFDLGRRVETDLVDEPKKCLEKRSRNLAFFFGAALGGSLPEEHEGPVTLKVRFVRAKEGGGSRSLDVEVAFGGEN